MYCGKVEDEDPTSKIENGLFVAWGLIHQPAEEVILVEQLRREKTFDFGRKLTGLSG